MLRYVAISMAVAVTAVPATAVRESPVLAQCKATVAEIDADERPSQQQLVTSGGVALDVPLGEVCVGPDSVAGGFTYVRRTTEAGGMAVVEVSATPFATVAPPGVAGVIGTPPDQPASW